MEQKFYTNPFDESIDSLIKQVAEKETTYETVCLSEPLPFVPTEETLPCKKAEIEPVFVSSNGAVLNEKYLSGKKLTTEDALAFLDRKWANRDLSWQNLDNNNYWIWHRLGDLTIVLIKTENEKLIGFGGALRGHGDRMNEKIGVKIALVRALRSMK